jgi:hypothetical protein
MSWQQLRNEAAANSRFEFSHDFPEHGAVRRLPIELAQPSNSFVIAQASTMKLPRRSQCKELAVSSPSSGSLEQQRHPQWQRWKQHTKPI